MSTSRTSSRRRPPQVPEVRDDGAEALEDRTSAPARRPSRPPIKVLELIDSWRRENKWSALRIALELAGRGHHYCVRTIGRWLQRLGISRRRDLDPTGEINREIGKIIARFPGHMLHLDVKKVRQIPDGGGWRLHGRGSKQARHPRVGYTYLHSSIDGYSRLAYTEALENETAATTIGFFSRARAFFSAHAINRLVRVVTDNGSNYRAKTFVRTVNAHASRHQRTRPYTPTTGGSSATSGSSLRNASTPTLSIPSMSVAKRSASGSSITTIIGRTPPALISPRPPESTNVSTTS